MTIVENPQVVPTKQALTYALGTIEECKHSSQEEVETKFLHIQRDIEARLIGIKAKKEFEGVLQTTSFPLPKIGEKMSLRVRSYLPTVSGDEECVVTLKTNAQEKEHFKSRHEDEFTYPLQRLEEVQDLLRTMDLPQGETTEKYRIGYTFAFGKTTIHIAIDKLDIDVKGENTYIEIESTTSTEVENFIRQYGHILCLDLRNATSASEKDIRKDIQKADNKETNSRRTKLAS